MPYSASTVAIAPARLATQPIATQIRALWCADTFQYRTCFEREASSIQWIASKLTEFLPQGQSLPALEPQRTCWGFVLLWSHADSHLDRHPVSFRLVRDHAHRNRLALA